jgi:hypothetical protein
MFLFCYFYYICKMNKSIMTTAIALILIGFSHTNSYSTEYSTPINHPHRDGRSLALGGARCGQTAPIQNSISLGYLLPFQLSSLSTRQLYGNTRLFNTQAEIGWAQTGDESFLENTISLHLIKKLSGRLNLGAGVGYYSFTPASGESGHFLYGEIICRYQLSNQSSVELNLTNPTNTKIRYGSENVKTTRYANGGITLSPNQSSTILAELELSSCLSPKGHFGLEYTFGDLLALRSGFSTAPFCPSWGLGSSFKRISLAYGGNLHPVLGLSLGLTITIFSRAKKDH